MKIHTPTNLPQAKRTDGSGSYTLRDYLGSFVIISMIALFVLPTFGYASMFNPFPRIYSITPSSAPGSISTDSVIKIYDAKTLQLIKETPTIGLKPYDFNKVPHRNFALINHFAPTSFIEIYDFFSDQVVGTIDTGLGPKHMTFSLDQKTAYVANANGNSVTAIDLDSVESSIDGATTVQTTTVNVGVDPNIAYEYPTPHGLLVFSANFGESSVTVLKATTLDHVKTIQVGDGPFSMVMTPDKKHVITANSNDGTVSWIDVQSLEEVHRTTFLGPLGSNRDLSKIQRTNPRISPEGKYLWIGNQQGGVFAILDLEQRKLVTEIPAGVGADIAYFPAAGPAFGYALLTNRYSATLTVAKLNNEHPPTFLKNIPVAEVGTHILSFSRDWKTAYVSERLGDSFSVIDLESMSETASVVVGQAPNEAKYIWFQPTLTGPKFYHYNEAGQKE